MCVFVYGSTEINATFNLCYSLLPNISAHRVAQLCPRFVAALTNDQNFALLKLKLLSTLFNLWTPPARFPIYIAILRFALASNNAAVLAGQFEHLKDWMREWKLEDADQTELYLLAARVSQANNQPYGYFSLFCVSLNIPHALILCVFVLFCYLF